MARVERGNVVLRVDDRDIAHYINLGYNVTDEFGNVIQESIPTNLGELQAIYLKQKEKIEELESIVAQLTSELETRNNVSQPTKKRTSKKAE